MKKLNELPEPYKGRMAEDIENITPFVEMIVDTMNEFECDNMDFEFESESGKQEIQVLITVINKPDGENKISNS